MFVDELREGMRDTMNEVGGREKKIVFVPKAGRGFDLVSCPVGS